MQSSNWNNKLSVYGHQLFRFNRGGGKHIHMSIYIQLCSQEFLPGVAMGEEGCDITVMSLPLPPPPGASSVLLGKGKVTSRVPLLWLAASSFLPQASAVIGHPPASWSAGRQSLPAALLPPKFWEGQGKPHEMGYPSLHPEATGLSLYVCDQPAWPIPYIRHKQ